MLRVSAHSGAGGWNQEAGEINSACPSKRVSTHMHFTGPQLATFRDALKLAFSKDDLALLLSDRLDKDIEEISGGGNKDIVFNDVLRRANAEEWILELAMAVRAARPKKSELRIAIERLGLLAPTEGVIDFAAQRQAGGAAQRSLEQIIRASNALIDVQVWRERLTEIEGQVCRIVYGQGAWAQPLGSGFLVGRSVVMTNHHVVSEAIAGTLSPTQIHAQFDYRVLADGSTQAGTFVPLRADWLIHAEPHDPIDVTAHAIEQDAQADKLDYALLRLASALGDAPIEPRAASGDVPRGKIDLTNPGPKPAADSALFIVQHPDGKPMKLALDTRAVIGHSPGERRIRYRTNTEPGSSGSPVFDQHWRIVALHHAGDPKFVDLPQYNEGIPVPAITQYPERKGSAVEARRVTCCSTSDSARRSPSS